MDKVYKYYMWFLKEDLFMSTNEFVPFIVRYPKDRIYAYTDDKKIADSYREIHDMNKFYQYTEKLTKEDVNKLAAVAQDMIIEPKDFSTCVNCDDNSMATKKICIALARWEYLAVQNFISKIYYDLLWKICWENPRIFKKPIQKVLGETGYINLYNDLVETGNVFKNLSVCPLKLDHLAVLMLLFNEVIK